MATVENPNRVAPDKSAPASDRENKGQNIEQGLLARLVQGVKFSIKQRADAWFPPNQPLQPVAQEQAKGRAFDYQVGINQVSSPRSGDQRGATFGQLRALADSYDLLRLAIETRKDQICSMKWNIKARDDEEDTETTRIDEVKNFLRFPDQQHDWETWLRMVLEDLFVIDAPTIYPRMNLGGGLYALEPVDGATIKVLIDETGRAPLPPDPAYQQILKGVPAVDYSRDELIYRPRNVRTHKMYGFGPVEQIIMTVNIALNRQVSQLSYYTEGNIPEAFIGVPEEWTSDQIQQFQQYWDSLLAGEVGQKRRARFVPATISKSFVQTKEAMLKDEFDEWLARIICFAFSLSAQWAVKQMNRATAETEKDSADEAGVVPIQLWIKNLVDYIIWKYFGYTDIEFSWEEEEAIDPLIQAQVAQIYEGMGVLLADEIRADLGKPPITPEQQAQIDEKAARMMGMMTGEGEEGEEGDDEEKEIKPKKGEVAKRTPKKLLKRSSVTGSSLRSRGRGRIAY